MERTERIQRAAMAECHAAGMSTRSAQEMPPVLHRAAPVQPEPVASMRGASHPHPAGTMQGMRAELETLRERLANAAPRRAVVEMDRAISMLHRKVEGLARTQDEAGRAEAGLLASELAELRTVLDDLGAPQRFQALAAGIDALSRKIEVMDAKAVSPVEVARLQAQSDQLADLVRRSLSGSGLQALAARLDACSAQVSRAGDAAAGKVQAATAAFEHQARELLSRMDTMGQSTRSDMAQIHLRLDTLATQMQQLSPAGAGVEDHLVRLSLKLDALGQMDKTAKDPLAAMVEQHLLRLNARVQHADERLSRLDGIEAGIQDILGELHHVHASSAEATAEAVQAVALKVSDASGGPAVVGLKRGLAALEARQNEVERRASEWLGEPFNDTSLVLGRTDEGVWAPHAADMAQAPQPVEPVHEPAEVDEDRAQEPQFDWPRDNWQPEPRIEPRQAMPEAAPDDQSPDVHSFATDPLPNDPAFDAAFADALSAERQEPAFEIPASSRWTGRKADPAASEQKAEAARPRVIRGNRPRPLRPQKHHVGWKGVAASVLAVALVSSVGLAWIKRDALQNHASALTQSMQARSVATASIADLPAPVGPAALQAEARAGNIAAAHEVGVRYAEGKGTPVNIDAAMKWLGYAVGKGSPQAAFTLGTLYENDMANPAEAKRFYGWAAEQGHVQAMHNLAALHAQSTNGKGADWAQAIHWFRTAAEYGKRDAQHNLGIIHARGLSGNTDMKEALTWFSIAANQGDADSAQKRDELSGQMDAATIDEVRRHAMAFRARPVNAAANVLALRPEWADPAEKGRMASQDKPYTPAAEQEQTSHAIPPQMFSTQAMNAMTGQMVASRR